MDEPFIDELLQIRVSRQDGSPITGTKQSVILHTDISALVPKSHATQYNQGLQNNLSIPYSFITLSPYYWGTETKTYQLDNQILTLPDTSLVAVNIQIPKNASTVNLQVCLNRHFIDSGHLVKTMWLTQKFYGMG